MKIKGIYFLYRVLQAIGLPFLLLYFLLRGLRNRGYWTSLAERFGCLPRSFRQTGPGAIWLHAVSVGEVLAAMGFLRRIRAEYPHAALFVSTSTLAGRAMASEKLKDIATGVFYAPVDYVFAVRRVIRQLKPSVVAVMETEIWPNLFRETKRTGAGIVIVNGRISDRAFARYRRFRWFFGAVLPEADAILTQTGEIRERFVAIGAPPGRTRAAGNLKFDFEARSAPAESPVLAFLAERAPQAVWIAASTTAPETAGDPDEDDVVISAFEQLAQRHPGLVLLIAPRKPERFDGTARKLESAGIPFVRRSALPAKGAASARVLLLDSIGELSGLFGAADVVFMGGTLPHRGGHNILEPALFAKPVIAGPHMENFQAIADDFRAEGASVEISGASELAGAVGRLLENPEEARAIGRRALHAAEARRGATARALEELGRIYRSRVPWYRPALPWYALGLPLTALWRWGTRRKQAGDRGRQGRLPVPVISVGNLTVGGTGKTPCVLRLAEILRGGGHHPGILTRGYGRSSPEGQLAIEAGGVVGPEHSGDEPQIFIRAGMASVGIGRDRYAAGRLLLREHHPDILILDDGFQHLRLARDVDVVLIDALNPFGGGAVVPVGRLREPIAALSRADIVLITRSEFSDLAPAIEHVVRTHNPHVPVFRAAVEPLAWVEHSTGREFAPEDHAFDRAAVFCGIGNPASFRRTLAGVGVTPVDWFEFEDHHHYRPAELRRIAERARLEGAGALVTTEKDSINLCEGAVDLVTPLPIFWLKVRMRIHGERELLEAVLHSAVHN